MIPLNFTLLANALTTVIALPPEHKFNIHRKGRQYCEGLTDSDHCCQWAMSISNFDLYFIEEHGEALKDIIAKTFRLSPFPRHLRPVESVDATCRHYAYQRLCDFSCRDTRHSDWIEDYKVSAQARFWAVRDGVTTMVLKKLLNIRRLDGFSILCPPKWLSRIEEVDTFWTEQAATEPKRTKAVCYQPNPNKTEIEAGGETKLKTNDQPATEAAQSDQMLVPMTMTEEIAAAYARDIVRADLPSTSVAAMIREQEIEQQRISHSIEVLLPKHFRESVGSEEADVAESSIRPAETKLAVECADFEDWIDHEILTDLDDRVPVELRLKPRNSPA